uniref:GH06740p n=1 Tax=Drosophila melanogaster TaxID=7227 RepID=Q9VKU0_DROME|eukprot:NP_001260355.1 Leucine-rich repeat 47, isoform B [Drosophila melanogaster]
MKILCEVQVVNRATQTNKTPRPVKSTLAIGYKQSARDANGNTKKELEMVLFSGQNKTGNRYKVKDNIHVVHTKFVLDGKTTIGFIQPPDNLLIKCDPIQLKGFLQTLKLGMDGKDAINLRLNINAATAIPQKAQPQVRMVISKRSEYPIKGFPRTLKSLTINNSQLVKLSFEICTLRNLTKLDVSGNKLTKIPSELGRLPLTSLHLGNNLLGTQNDWCWLRGTKLCQSLGELDLSGNGLTYFPPPLVKFESLVSLNLNNNLLSRLPFAIRRMKALRKLYVCSNELESLPSAVEDLRIDLLDVWGNCFKEFNADAAQQMYLQKAASNSPQPLWLLGARAVDKYMLPLSAGSIPAVLIDLIREAPRCPCGELCYAQRKEDLFQRVVQPKFITVKNLTYSREHQIYADVVLCDSRCSASAELKLLFNIIFS